MRQSYITGLPLPPTERTEPGVKRGRGGPSQWKRPDTLELARLTEEERAMYLRNLALSGRPDKVVQVQSSYRSSITGQQIPLTSSTRRVPVGRPGVPVRARGAGITTLPEKPRPVDDAVSSDALARRISAYERRAMELAEQEQKLKGRELAYNDLRLEMGMEDLEKERRSREVDDLRTGQEYEVRERAKFTPILSPVLRLAEED